MWRPVVAAVSIAFALQHILRDVLGGAIQAGMAIQINSVYGLGSPLLERLLTLESLAGLAAMASPWVLLAAGITCWRGKSKTRLLHLIWVGLQLAILAATLAIEFRHRASMYDRSIWRIALYYLPLIINLVYPLVVLAWMLHPAIRAEIAQWQMQEELDSQTDANGPQA